MEEKEIKEREKEKKVEPRKYNNKQLLIVLAAIIGSMFLISIVVPALFVGSEQTIKTSEGRVKITKSKNKTIQYETYDNGLVSFQMPKGWKVDVPEVDYIHYSFKVYNPEDPTYRIIFMMKLEGFNKTEDARNWQKRYYPNVVFAKLPVIDPQTTESFYNVWNETAEYVNTNNLSYEYLPQLNDFTVIENLATNEIGGDVLRATYKDNDKTVQGLFTASVKEIGTYYVSSNILNIFSSKVDVSPLNVYNIILMTAPDEEFNNWQSILDKCISTISFSDKFVNGFNKEEKNIASTIQANQKVYNEMSDMIMDSWQKRNNFYDIMSQKQSDATLGYERVYDTETGEVYKAYNGFTDDYKGERYKSITDDMYTSTISGYIEK